MNRRDFLTANDKIVNVYIGGKPTSKIIRGGSFTGKTIRPDPRTIAHPVPNHRNGLSLSSSVDVVKEAFPQGVTMALTITFTWECEICGATEELTHKQLSMGHMVNERWLPNAWQWVIQRTKIGYSEDPKVICPKHMVIIDPDHRSLDAPQPTALAKRLEKADEFAEHIRRHP